MGSRIFGDSRRWIALGGVWLIGLAVSGAIATDLATWAMEVAPVPIAFLLIAGTQAGRGLSRLALVLIGVHGLVLMLGGAYSYAQVPIGFRVQELFGLDRNPYDRFGHFMQGFVPAVALRELLPKAGIRRMLTLTVFAYCLAFSALYELIEFGAAVALGQGADAFLGTQGDPWDTQWDMLFCLIGAVSAWILLSRLQDRLLHQRT